MRVRLNKPLRHNSVEYVALFLVLGGTAWALGNNSVRSSHIADKQVKGKDIRASQVQARVEGACSPGQSIRAIDAGGEAACEPTPAGGPPSGAASGDLTGSYPNPEIAVGAVKTLSVSDNSLTGADIDESTLDQVPSALLGNFGRT